MRSYHFPHWRTQLPWLGILAALLTTTLIAVVFFVSIGRAQTHSLQTGHAARIISDLEQTALLLRNAQEGVRGFILSGQPDFLHPYSTAQHQIETKLLSLRQAASSKTQRYALDYLEDLIADSLLQLQQALDLRRASPDPQTALAYVSSGQSERALERVRTQVGLMQEQEKNWLASRETGATLSARYMKILIVVGTTLTYLMLVGAFWLLKRENRRRQLAEQALTRANAALLRRAEQLKVTNLELESFSYSISHDLRIPLRAVVGYARMLEEDHAERLDDEGRRLLQVIRDNGQRMGQLIDDLLAFSRLGRKEITATEIDMHELVEPQVGDVRRHEKYTAVEFDIGTLAPAWGDRALLQQVWINLISNAVKYSSGRTPPQVRISSTIADEEIIYSVSDNGVGFDMQYYDKLFGVFQRLHGADEFPGSGVGLAIVQRIVMRHGGRVWAEAQLDRGATFFFALPNNGALHG